MTHADPFDIIADPQHGLLRITMRGHWDVETVRRYKDAIGRAAAGLYDAGNAPGSLVALVDVRGGGAQSQEVIAYYQEELGGPYGPAPRRLATLVSSALFKRQVERIAIANQRLFTDEKEALDWLLSEDIEES